MFHSSSLQYLHFYYSNSRYCIILSQSGQCAYSDIWPPLNATTHNGSGSGEPHSLWNAKLFPIVNKHLRGQVRSKCDLKTVLTWFMRPISRHSVSGDSCRMAAVAVWRESERVSLVDVLGMGCAESMLMWRVMTNAVHTVSHHSSTSPSDAGSTVVCDGPLLPSSPQHSLTDMSDVSSAVNNALRHVLAEINATHYCQQQSQPPSSVAVASSFLLGLMCVRLCQEEHWTFEDCRIPATSCANESGGQAKMDANGHDLTPQLVSLPSLLAAKMGSYHPPISEATWSIILSHVDRMWALCFARGLIVTMNQYILSLVQLYGASPNLLHVIRTLWPTVIVPKHYPRYLLLHEWLRNAGVLSVTFLPHSDSEDSIHNCSANGYDTFKQEISSIEHSCIVFSHDATMSCMVDKLMTCLAVVVPDESVPVTSSCGDSRCVQDVDAVIPYVVQVPV
jgi:hypothetical protein